VLPIPHELMGRKIAVVTDEEVSDRLTPSPNAFLWIVDITDEKHPVPVATWRVPHDEPFNRDCWFGAHQPQETVNGNVILVTWFGGGLRAVDISNPTGRRRSTISCRPPAQARTSCSRTTCSSTRPAASST
jgi:hypothetical protein